MTTLTAYYDLAVGPVSFDFVQFAIQAKMAARRVGAEQLYFVFVPDASRPSGFRDKSNFYDDDEANWRIWNICIPTCALLGAKPIYVNDWDDARRIDTKYKWPDDWDRQSKARRWHLFGDLIRRARAGEQVPVLNAPEYARRAVRRYFSGLKLPIVTMTKRSIYLPERNSIDSVWHRAKEHIEARGFRVVEMSDTQTALMRGSGYGELNLYVRMACYEQAALNLQSHGGAANLCWFSDRPYMMFGAGVPEAEWDGLIVKQGLPLGQTWPWAKAQQRLVYGKETADSIIAEFDAWATATN